MFGKNSKPNGRIDSLIGAGTTIEGNITFTGGLRIDGEVRGNVYSSGEQPGTLVVSEHARKTLRVGVFIAEPFRWTWLKGFRTT